MYNFFLTLLGMDATNWQSNGTIVLIYFSLLKFKLVSVLLSTLVMRVSDSQMWDF